jgi:hypothetical protein
MKVGIVSDSHGSVKRLRKALALLAERGAEAVVHCGDVGSPECIEALASGWSACAVAGNMDRRLERLAAAAERCGVRFSREAMTVPLGGGRLLAAAHGDAAVVLDELIRSGRFAYVCHGHTHRPRDERVGATRVINPGALRRPRGRLGPTALLLDTDADEVEFLRVR